MKVLLLMMICALISGCPMGREIPFSHEGRAFISGDMVCIGSNKGDVLNFYSLSSTEDNDKKYILNTGYGSLHYQYPKTCFTAPLKNGYKYTLQYELNNQTYTYEFFIDLNGRISDIRRGN